MDQLPIHEDVVEFVNAGVAGFIMKDVTLFSQISRESMLGPPATTLETVRMTPRG